MTLAYFDMSLSKQLFPDGRVEHTAKPGNDSGGKGKKEKTIRQIGKSVLW